MNQKASIDQQKLNEFFDHSFYDLSAGYMGVMISIGHKLGLYRTLAENGPLTAQEVAERSKCEPRYVTEWLNSQAAGGYALYHPETETYALSPEQQLVLVDEQSPYFMPDAWNVPASMWFDEEKTLETFRNGTAFGWGEHDPRMSCGSAAFFRNSYKANLIQNWLPSLDGVVEKLERGAKVADIGCGHGHSTTIMARAFPNSEFFGFDNDPGSIKHANQKASDPEIARRVHFEVSSATHFRGSQFDLICYFDSFHDMGDPVSAARHARAALAENGSVLLVEPYAGDRVEDNINPVGRLFYAASTTICCPHSKSEKVGLALGAQAGPKRLKEVFMQAGFEHFSSAMQTPFNLVLQASR